MKRAYTDEHAQSGVHAPLPEIETWPNQYDDYEIEIVTPEFTSVCPKTGLPDFGKLILRYVPGKLCLELKSYKMYLNEYRNLGIFQENVVNRVLRDVVSAAKPKMATVVGDFAPRGGLTTVVTATWIRPGGPVENAELIAILQEVRDRVRARNPETAAGIDIALPDLMPLVHARDSAMGKVAAIGTVNPRSGGVVNSLVQAWKRFVARVLDWHVREQVEFNRKMVGYADAAVEALRESNRALTEMGSRLHAQELIGHDVSIQMGDIRDHWASWRIDWERKLEKNEIQFLRSVADLQGGFQHRVTLMEASHRDLMREHNVDFHGALERHGFDIQKRLWADLEKMRAEIERMIHAELRMIRQRAQLGSTGNLVAGVVSSEVSKTTQAGNKIASATGDALPMDYARFAERFRGSEEYVKAGQAFYLPYFEGATNVLDIGCGRGEFLEMMRAHNIPAKGIDLSEESVGACRLKGLDAEVADLFPYLEALPEAALDGIFCSQVVEHIAPDRLPELIRLCASRLSRNGVIAIETPNPECLAIFATHFYLDPTHQRPVPHPLLMFYLEEYGVGKMEVRRLAPAKDTMPALKSLPDDFREAFFGALDYAVIGRKL